MLLPWDYIKNKSHFGYWDGVKLILVKDKTKKHF